MSEKEKMNQDGAEEKAKETKPAKADKEKAKAKADKEKKSPALASGLPGSSGSCGLS